MPSFFSIIHSYSPLCFLENIFFPDRGKSLLSRFSLIVPVPEYPQYFKKLSKLALVNKLSQNIRYDMLLFLVGSFYIKYTRGAVHLPKIFS